MPTSSKKPTRRSHRSFRLTRRRDYRRPLVLPGYLGLTGEVNRTLLKYRPTFLLLALCYALISALVVGLASQDIYMSLTDTLRQTGAELFDGNLGQLGQASLLFVSIASSGLSTTPTDVQQLYAGLLVLLVWLTTVWLLRNLLAGHRVGLRDGLYNAAAPLVATTVVALVLLLQLLPLALAAIGYSAATSTGLLAGGVEAMLFWIAAGLLTILSLYMLSSTFIALIVVTLPGMYPLRALRVAAEMVAGRRVRILFRLLWMVLCLLVTWAVVMIPFIILDTWLKGVLPAINWLPLIPLLFVVLSSLTVIWSSTYVYILYRKVVDDDATPA